MKEPINNINKFIPRNYNYYVINNNNRKGLIFIIIYINISLILRAEAFIKYLNKYVIINNNRALKVLKFIKLILKLIIILIKI